LIGLIDRVIEMYFVDKEEEKHFLGVLAGALSCKLHYIV